MVSRSQLGDSPRYECTRQREKVMPQSAEQLAVLRGAGAVTSNEADQRGRPGGCSR